LLLVVELSLETPLISKMPTITRPSHQLLQLAHTLSTIAIQIFANSAWISQTLSWPQQVVQCPQTICT